MIWMRAPELLLVPVVFVMLLILASLAGPRGRVFIWGTRPAWWIGDLWRRRP